MPEGVVAELAEIIGDRLNQLGLTLMKGILFQAAPDYRTEGVVLQGERKYPFVSVTHMQPEQPDLSASTNTSMMITRVFTVAIVADKAIVEKTPAAYTHYRERAIRALHTYRANGTLTSVQNACIMHATVRPSSPLQQSAWRDAARFISTFDVLFQTEEPTGVT